MNAASGAARPWGWVRGLHPGWLQHSEGGAEPGGVCTAQPCPAWLHPQAGGQRQALWGGRRLALAKASVCLVPRSVLLVPLRPAAARLCPGPCTYVSRQEPVGMKRAVGNPPGWLQHRHPHLTPINEEHNSRRLLMGCSAEPRLFCFLNFFLVKRYVFIYI